MPVLTDNCPLIANGADWSAKREAHPFRMDGLREWLASQVEPMRAMLREGIRLLKNLPGPVDVRQTVQHLGFDAFSVAVWGHVLGADVYEWFLTLGKDRRPPHEARRDGAAVAADQPVVLFGATEVVRPVFLSH